MKYLRDTNRRYEVYVDGERVTHVIEADSDEGYAICAKLPLSVDSDNNLRTHVLRGNVIIEEIEESK